MSKIIDGGIEVADVLDFDAVIVGGGIAGLYAALHMAPGVSCAVMTKEALDISNSWLAQGGIAAAIDKDDRPQFHLEDTLTAGAGLCDEAAVRVLVDEGPEQIRYLREHNVPFDLDAYGDIHITREGGHRRNRIVHAHGDATGRETVKTLTAITAARDNITMLPHAFLIDLVTDGSEITGLLFYDGRYRLIACRNIILATGGSGQVYIHTTNPVIATGDGVAAAYRAGAKIKDMEFIQFHPTALYGKCNEPTSFLISEALRGEGAYLRTPGGDRFMPGRHPMAELAPRDIVAREIVREMAETGSEFVYLDITHKSGEFLSERFPTIYNECKKRGIDIAKDLIPVRPVQHYIMGGIEADLYSRTNIKGLFACGEAACTGVHGANRLASNSMLECLVFSRRAAEYICGGRDMSKPKPEPSRAPRRFTDDFSAADTKGRIKRVMDESCGVIRRAEGLKSGLEAVSSIREGLEDISDKAGPDAVFREDAMEAYNMAIVAERILENAFDRKESVGAHFIEGF